MATCKEFWHFQTSPDDKYFFPSIFRVIKSFLASATILLIITIPRSSKVLHAQSYTLQSLLYFPSFKLVSPDNNQINLILCNQVLDLILIFLMLLHFLLDAQLQFLLPLFIFLSATLHLGHLPGRCQVH